MLCTCERQSAVFTNNTFSGTHGPTGQFGMMYDGYINLFHQFVRAIRINLQMTLITDLFFTTAHVNYPRWLTKHQLERLSMVALL